MESIFIALTILFILLPRKQYLGSITTLSARVLDINRSNLYSDVILLFQNEKALTYSPLQISFVGERALDCGGVCRDTLSSFWEEAYRHHFDGNTLLTPAIHAQSNHFQYSVLFSPMATCCGLHTCTYCLSSMLLGQVESRIPCLVRALPRA